MILVMIICWGMYVVRLNIISHHQAEVEVVARQVLLIGVLRVRHVMETVVQMVHMIHVVLLVLL